MNSDKQVNPDSNLSFEEEPKEEEKNEDKGQSSPSVASNSNQILAKKTPNKEIPLNTMNGKKSLSLKEVTNIIPLSSHKKSLHFPSI